MFVSFISILFALVLAQVFIPNLLRYDISVRVKYG